MIRPRSLRILGRTFPVRLGVPDDCYGTCQYDPPRIGLRAGLEAFAERETLLHECMHAILHQQGTNHEYELEESFVRPLAMGIMTLLADNPKLAEWLVNIKEK